MKGIHIFEHIPLLPIAVSLIIGILTSFALKYTFDASHWLLLLVTCLFLCVIIYKYKVLQTYFILFSVFALGGVISLLAESKKNVNLPSYESTYSGVVISTPTERGKIVRFDVLITEGDLCGRKVRMSLLKDSITHKYKSINVNTGLIFKSKLSSPSNYKGSRFDYASYLLNHGIIAQSFVVDSKLHIANISLLKLSLFDRALLKVLRFRSEILNHLKHLGLHHESSAIVSAMVLGDKSSLSEQQRSIFSMTGASHVLALSGLHLTIIYALLTFMTFGRRKTAISSIFLITAIWSYVFLVGMMPSVVRAAIMLTIFTLVGITGRYPLSLNVLCFAAILMLIVNPLNLYDVGFQLSFMAVGFIVSFNRYVNTIIPVKWQLTHRIANWFCQLGIISILAQLGTMPLVVYYFGNIPLFSLFTNFIVIPCTTVILYLSVLLLITSSVSFLANILVWALDVVVGFQNLVLERVASCPFAAINNVQITGAQVILVYMIIFCLLFLFYLVFIKKYPRQFIGEG